VEPSKIIAAAKKEGVGITHILTTHSHWDHAGGNKELFKLLDGKVEVVGGANDGIPCATLEVKEGDKIKIGSTVEVSVLDTPCHTRGHVSFYCTSLLSDDDKKTGKRSPDTAVFTGDTMFVAGCGNFNWGTGEQMFSAFQKIGKLPPQTKVYCGHEYTLRNLAFAAFASPEDDKIKERLKWAEGRRKAGKPTVPSTIKDEWETNLFLQAKGPSEITKVRKDKDVWGQSH